MNRPQSEPVDQMTFAEKTSYLSGVMDGVEMMDETRVICKQYLADLLVEIASKQKAKDPFAIH
jgi:hypothetical protein